MRAPSILLACLGLAGPAHPVAAAGEPADPIERTRSESIADLPAIETEWWDAIRERPWSETYPEIFHHTWIVPARWADLALRCARGHRLDPSCGLGEKGVEVLLGLSAYPCEARHYDVGMNTAVWGVDALEAYRALRDLFDPEERSRMDALFERMAEAILENDRFWIENEPGGAINNHYAWHKLGLIAIGLAYDRPELVEESLHGPKGVDFLMDYGFCDDGLWIEGSIPYQLAATHPLVRTAELLEEHGYPTRLWGRVSGDGRRVEDAYGALLGLLFPDRTLPTIGDCYGRRSHLGAHPDWKVLARRAKDPRFAWIREDAQGSSPLAPPPQESRIWLEHGYAALRSVEGRDYWSGRGWTVFARWSARPVHANADKLSIQLFADGRLWLPDLEARPSAEHAFSARVQRELNRATLCHNALVVDGASQRHPDRTLELLEFQNLDLAKRLSIGDLEGRLYPGVRQLRTLIVTKDHVLDVLQVRADRERELAWTVHVDGRPGWSSARAGEPVDLPASPPWSYLRDARTTSIEDRYSESFHAEGQELRLDVLVRAPDGAALDVLACAFPREEGPAPITVPMRMLRARAGRATFVAVYRTGATAKDPLACAVADDVLDRLRVDLRIGERTIRHRVPTLP